MLERLARFPDLHVYHYAPYEPTALKRLMGMHATREDELDRLLRNKVLVDLYAVVRQSLRISQPSYSIKKLEVFYMDERETDVSEGGDSIVAFEKFLDRLHSLDARHLGAALRIGCVRLLTLDQELATAARAECRSPGGPQ